MSSGILTKNEIIKYKLIENINSAENHPSLKVTNYNLKLGDGHYVFILDRGWVPLWIGQRSLLEERNELQPAFEAKPFIELEPFGVALIQLKEIVNTLDCLEDNVIICGRFDLKLTLVTKGVFSQQATQVEPGYKGNLFCYIGNQTNDAIKLYPGDEIATIEFSYASRAVSDADFQDYQASIRSINSKYSKKQFCSDTGINDVRYFGLNAGHILPEHGGLKHFMARFEEMEKSLKREDLIKQAKEAVEEKFKLLESSVNSTVTNYKDMIKERLVVIGVVLTIVSALLYFLVSSYINNKNEALNLKFEYMQKDIEVIKRAQQSHEAIKSRDEYNRTAEKSNAKK